MLKTPTSSSPARHDASPEHSSRARGRLQAVGVVVPVAVGLLIGTLFAVLFLAAFHDPKPHDIPMAVAGQQEAVDAVMTEAERAGDVFDLEAYSDADLARQAVEGRDVLGALLVEPNGWTLVLAGANGQGVSQTLEGAFGPAAERAGMQFRVQDVAPLAEGDSRGLSVFYGAFGVVLAGFLFGLTSMQAAPHLGARARLGSVVGFAVIEGLLIAVFMDLVFEALPAPFAVTTLLVALLAVTVALTTIALLAAFRRTGTLVSAIILLTLGNVTSTGILPSQYLPTWLEVLVPASPVGATVRALRGQAYFGGDGLSAAFIVLTAWIVVSVLLWMLVERRKYVAPVASS